MAEAFLNRIAGDRFEAESAGIEPGVLNPVVIDAMRDAGIDVSGNRTKSVHDLIRKGNTYDYVVTVCDEASAEKCPIFPGSGKRVHMGFPDPSSFEGPYAERLKKTKRR